MKYYYFKSETSDLNDIVKDKILKKHRELIIRWTEHLIVGLKENCGKEIESYILLKYGDFVIDNHVLIPDRTPIPGKEYLPSTKNIHKYNILKSK